MVIDKLKIFIVFYLIINLITTSNSNAFGKNTKQYDADSNLSFTNVNTIRLRTKRETSTSYQNVQQNESNTVMHTQGQPSEEEQSQTVAISKPLPTSILPLVLQKDQETLPIIQTEQSNISSTLKLDELIPQTIETPPHKIFVPDLTFNEPLLGINSTGQQKDNTSTIRPPFVSEPITSPHPSAINDILNAVNVSETKTNELGNNQNLSYKEEYHEYYNSTQIINEMTVNEYWQKLKLINPNQVLSTSHRKGTSVQLTFDFPFFGLLVRNITVVTGGFLYTGEYVHQWLAATQYIAPLMANFDTSLSNDSYVRYDDNGTAFSVLWENVLLHENPEAGKFTFSVTLYDTGDIVFIYYKIPIKIKAIQVENHPVAIGLSDAYIFDRVVFFTRGKTIYEYYRIKLNQTDIQNNNIIYLKPLPTCLPYTDCASCMNHNTSFNCTWCSKLQKCSTGVDRNRQNWLENGCDTNAIKDASSCREKSLKYSDNDESESLLE